MSYSVAPAPQCPLDFLANVCIQRSMEESSHTLSPLASPSPSNASLPDSGYGSSSSERPKKTMKKGKTKAGPKSKLYSNRTSPCQLSPEPDVHTKKRTTPHPSVSETRAILNRGKMRSRREELAEKAAKMETVMNSPVNEIQYAVLRMVYDTITPYPPEPYMNILAVVLARSYRQIKNWFSNERQKNKVTPASLQEHLTITGENLRLRLGAVRICDTEDWSDELFDDLVQTAYLGAGVDAWAERRVLKGSPAPSSSAGSL
ncbi:hypothetical protein DL96DRAFT_1550282 [Flagelloscypha sp. PMI_526]|nr:hypothetical protein DL96DRAFT_1550282 [Flagelloscypha sp. PMI_526]